MTVGLGRASIRSDDGGRLWPMPPTHSSRSVPPALTTDGRLVVGCNVENASYGLTLCAECGLVSALHATGGGRLASVSIVAEDGQPARAVRALPPAALRSRRRPAARRCRPGAGPHSASLLPSAFSPRRRGGTPCAVLTSSTSSGRSGTARPSTASAISWLVGAYARDEVPDEQMAALLMAIYFRGLEPSELQALTKAIIDSGERLDLGAAGRPDSRQALDRRRRRQGLPRPRSPRRLLRGGRPAAVRSGPRAHRRHARQARVDPRLPLGAVAAGDDRRPVRASAVSSRRPGPAWRRRTGGSTRCATSPGRSSRSRSSPARSCRRRSPRGPPPSCSTSRWAAAPSWSSEADARRLAETMVGLGTDYGVRTTALLTRDGRAARQQCRQRSRGGGVPRDDERRRSGRPRRGDAGPRRARCLPSSGIEADPAAVLESGQALGRFKEMVEAQGGDPGRHRCRGPSTSSRCEATAPATCGGSTPGRSASPPGVSAPAVPASRTP